MPNLTGLFAGLAGFPMGIEEAQILQMQRQKQAQSAAVQQLAMQKAQDEQRAGDVQMAGLLKAYQMRQPQPQMQPQPIPSQPSPLSPMPQVPSMAGAMGGPPQQPPLQQRQTFGGMSGGLPSLPSLVAQMESSGGADTASQPPSMVDKVYGQYPGFAQDYGTGAGGVMNFAQRMLRDKPDATVGDFYANYVLNTGATNKTPADLASTTVPGAQGAYRNMETKLASAGVSDATPLSSFVLNGQMGIPGAAFARQGADVPSVKNAANIGADATYSLPMNQYVMLDIPTIAKAVDEVAPNESGHVKAMAVGNIIKLAAPEERLAYQQVMQNNRLEWQLSMMRERETDIDRRAAAREADSVGKGGSMYQPTDAQGQPMGPPMWVAQGRASPIQGLPEGAAGGAKIGTRPLGQDAVTDAQAEFELNYLKATGSWTVGSGRNKALQNKVLQLAAKEGLDPAQIAQAAGSFQANKSSLAAAQKLADTSHSYEETALKNLKNATSQIHDVSPSDWGPFVNKWLETGETFVGNPNVPASVASVVTVANEYAKIISGSTGAAAATEGSRQEAMRILNPYFSAGQWDTVVDKVIVPDMKNRTESLYENVDYIRGRIGRPGPAGQPPITEGPFGAGMPKAAAKPSAAAPDISTMPKDQFQQYITAMTREQWDKLTLTQQQAIIARTKADQAQQ